MNTQELALFLYEEEQRLGVEFMDKKIANGIYIQDGDWIRQLLDINEFRETYINTSKILGHLGLSSILKYMKYSYYICTCKGDFFECACIGEDIEYFPNKELHLYTKQELKNLKTLLHKLKEGKT